MIETRRLKNVVIFTQTILSISAALHLIWSTEKLDLKIFGGSTIYTQISFSLTRFVLINLMLPFFRLSISHTSSTQ